MARENTNPTHGKLPNSQKKDANNSKTNHSTAAFSAQATTPKVEALPFGPHVSFTDVNDLIKDGVETALDCSVNMHYFYDASKQTDNTLPSYYLAKAAELNQGNISVTHVELFDGVSVDDIQPLLLGAIKHALQYKNGYLYLELIGATLPGIEPLAYAKMLEDTIFSIPAEKLEQLAIIFLDNTGKKKEGEKTDIERGYPQHKTIEDALKISLVLRRIKRLVLQELNLKPGSAENIQYIDAFIEMLREVISSEGFEHLRTYFLECNSIRPMYNEKTGRSEPSVIQKESFLETMTGLADVVVNNLFKHLYVIEHGEIRRGVSNFKSVFNKQAIATIAYAFDNHLALDGFIFAAKYGERPTLSTALDTMLTTVDIQVALCHLAVNYPEKAEEILNIKVATQGSLDEVLEKIRQRDQYPRHVIVHNSAKQYANGGHWTRIVVTKSPDGGIKQREIDSMYTTGDQADGWTCGYHALTGALRGIVSENRTRPEFQNWTKEELDGVGLPEQGVNCPDGVPNSNLKVDGKARTKRLVNWLLKLIFSSGYLREDLEVELQSGAESSQRPREQSPKHLAIDALLETHLKAIRQIGAQHDCEAMLLRISQIEASMQTIQTALEAKGEGFLSQEFYLAYAKKLKDLKSSVEQITGSLKADPRYSEDDLRQRTIGQRLQALTDRHHVLTALLEVAKKREVVIEPKRKKTPTLKTASVTNPMLATLDVLHEQKLKSEFDKFKPLALSSVDNLRYEKLFSEALTFEISNRLLKSQHGLEKNKVINKAIRDIDYCVIDKLLDQVLKEVCPDAEHGNNTHAKYRELRAYYQSIQERKPSAEHTELTYQDSLIEMCFQRIVIDQDKMLQLRRDDPERRKALLAAFDNPQSDLFKALNFKRHNFLGMSFTFFSGASWRDMINGDSQVVKNMKIVDNLLRTSQHSTENVELVGKLSQLSINAKGA